MSNAHSKLSLLAAFAAEAVVRVCGNRVIGSRPDNARRPAPLSMRRGVKR